MVTHHGGKPDRPARRPTSVNAHAEALAVRPGDSWDADAALEQLYAAHWRELVRLAVKMNLVDVPGLTGDEAAGVADPEPR